MADRQLRVNFSVNEADLVRFTDKLLKAGVAAKDVEDILTDIKNKSTSDPPFEKAAAGLDQLVTGVKAFLALEVVNYIKNAAIEASKLAAAGEGIRSAFKNLGGATSDLDMLRKSVGGTVADIDLLRISVQALQKGVGLNTLGQTLAYLDKQADATGGSLEQMAGIMINAIGKQSTRGLQQLGLSIKDIEKNANSIGFVPALMQEISAKSLKLGDVTSGAGDSFDKLAASQKNLKEAFGNLVNSSGFIKLQSFLAQTVQGTANIFNEQNSALLQARTKVQFAQLVIQDAAGASPEVRARNAEFLKKALEELSALEIVESRRLRKVQFEQEKIQLQGKLDEQAEIDAKFQESQAKLKKDKAVKAAEERAKAELAAYQKVISDDLAAGVESSNITAGIIAGVNRTGDLNEVERLDAALGIEEVDEIITEIPTATEKAKLDFQDMAVATVQIVDLFKSLNEEGANSPKDFLKLFLKAAGTILAFIPGGQPVAAGISVLGGLFNEGGMIGAPVGPNRDSLLIGATPGEYMINRNSTKRSGLLLDAINAGEIDDRILLKLQQSPVVVNVDQAKVVEAIQNMPQVDFYKNGSVLYEVRTQRASARSERIRRTTL